MESAEPTEPTETSDDHSNDGIESELTDELREEYYEDIIIPKKAEKEKGPDDKVRQWPALDEPDPEMELKHQTHGHTVGGQADMATMKDLIRLTSEVDFKSKEKGENDYIAYMRNEKHFLSIIETIANKESPNIYQLVGLFSNKTRKIYRHQVEKLLVKKKHFTSFRHFLREFRDLQWPNQQQTALAEAERCIQGKKNPAQYFETWVNLQKMAGLDPEKRIEAFIAGLRDEDTREKVRYENYPPGERTLEKVKNHVEQITTQRRVARIMDAKSKPKDGVIASNETGKKKLGKNWGDVILRKIYSFS